MTEPVRNRGLSIGMRRSNSTYNSTSNIPPQTTSAVADNTNANRLGLTLKFAGVSDDGGTLSRSQSARTVGNGRDRGFSIGVRRAKPSTNTVTTKKFGNIVTSPRAKNNRSSFIGLRRSNTYIPKSTTTPELQPVEEPEEPVLSLDTGGFTLLGDHIEENSTSNLSRSSILDSSGVLLHFVEENDSVKVNNDIPDQPVLELKQGRFSIDLNGIDINNINELDFGLIDEYDDDQLQEMLNSAGLNFSINDEIDYDFLNETSTPTTIDIEKDNDFDVFTVPEGFCSTLQWVFSCDDIHEYLSLQSGGRFVKSSSDFYGYVRGFMPFDVVSCFYEVTVKQFSENLVGTALSIGIGSDDKDYSTKITSTDMFNTASVLLYEINETLKIGDKIGILVDNTLRRLTVYLNYRVLETVLFTDEIPDYFFSLRGTFPLICLQGDITLAISPKVDTSKYTDIKFHDQGNQIPSMCL
eukprot:TRINITY_DN3365_c0_g1_i1.p1 TRINITY_DN3365_c0_g1~~TRINITY_DN3365_c0_g1_i1.p1  ORF type:complete len:501 (-),score=106.64 TRINITY_DN3365_c0_g1_i1:366-1766(-)